ncbi:hypothetical protein C8R43DRAFT_49641 [Mycena crocata]|nr:hypothetical protein C8R43DRAFT_49641 [Mycena crocata]
MAPFASTDIPIYDFTAFSSSPPHQSAGCTMNFEPPSKSAASISVIIVGGSVAGLCAAYKLKKSGHSVTVLEKRKHNELVEVSTDVLPSRFYNSRTQSHGGLRVPPNMTRLIETMEDFVDDDGETREISRMKELLRTRGTECKGMTFLEDESHPLGKMHFLDETIEDLGCNFYMIPYDDFIQHILRLCKEVGVDVQFKTQVASVQLEGDHPSVVTNTGKTWKGDLLIGADGRNSIIHNALLQRLESGREDEDEEGYSDSDSVSERHSSGISEIVGATYSINMSSLKNDPELSTLTSSNEFMIWPGSHVLVTGHKCGPDLYIATVTQATGVTAADKDSDWLPNEPFPDVDALIGEFEPRVKRLLKAASHYHKTIQRVPEKRQIVDTQSNVVVIGDAAHTITIHATHNTSIAVEDAFTLANLFSRIPTKEQIPRFLQGYHHIRYKRSMKTEASELGAFVVITFPPGPARDMRNQQFAVTLQEKDLPDDILAQTWNEYIDQFRYDANDAAAEWYLMWGRTPTENAFSSD